MAALIATTAADGKVTYSANPVEESFFMKPINGLTQMIGGDPLSASEAVALTAAGAFAGWAFGYKKGYDDRMTGSPRKTLGLF